MAAERSEFLSAVDSLPAESGVRALHALLDRHSSRADSLNLVELLETVPRARGPAIWASIRGAVSSAADAFNGDDDSESSSQSNDLELSVMVLHVACQLAQLWLDDPKRPQSGALVDTVERLHETLFALEEEAGLQTQICRLCERWWVTELPGRERFVTQLLPLLLIRSLEDDAREADIKRAYAVRGMIELLDLEDESAATLKQLLLRCFMSPLYLRCAEGQRMLAGLFQVDDEFVSDIHATVKAQLPFVNARSGAVETYAEIYFKAWRSSEGPCRLQIEEVALQDLMECAVHCADRGLSLTLHRFLAVGFHERKRVRGVDEMLARLYAPFLWRSLSVANAGVRRNSIAILAEAFPLQDPDAPVTEVEKELSRQFRAFETALKDPNPLVRATCVGGVCRILSIYWELMPQRVVAGFLETLVGDLAFDKSSVNVRVAVIEGLSLLVSSPLAQPALKAALPHLAPHVHDASPLVRSAMVSLLVKVRGVRSIKFYEVCAVPDLLERLAIDGGSGDGSGGGGGKCVPSVAGKMVELLLPSFYPQGEHGAEQLKRALSLVKRHPRAAIAFFANLHRQVTVGSVAKLITLFSRWCTTRAAKFTSNDGKASGRKRRRDAKRGAAEDEDGEEDEDGVVEAAVASAELKAARMARGVLWSIVALWGSIAPKLASKRYANAANDVNAEWADPSALLSWEALKEDGDTEGSVCDGVGGTGYDGLLRVMALMTPTSPPYQELQQELVTRILSFQPDDPDLASCKAMPGAAVARVDTELAPALSCLCAWGKEMTVLRGAVTALKSALDPAAPQRAAVAADSKKRKKGDRRQARKREAEQERPTLHPVVAAWAVQWILANGEESGARARMLAQTAQVDALASTLALAKARVVAIVSGGDDARATDDGTAAATDVDSSGVLTAALSTLAKLLLHRAANEHIMALNAHHELQQQRRKLGDAESSNATAQQAASSSVLVSPKASFPTALASLWEWALEALAPTLPTRKESTDPLSMRAKRARTMAESEGGGALPNRSRRRGKPKARAGKKEKVGSRKRGEGEQCAESAAAEQDPAYADAAARSELGVGAILVIMSAVGEACTLGFAADLSGEVDACSDDDGTDDGGGAERIASLVRRTNATVTCLRERGAVGDTEVSAALSRVLFSAVARHTRALHGAGCAMRSAMLLWIKECIGSGGEEGGSTLRAFLGALMRGRKAFVPHGGGDGATLAGDLIGGLVVPTAIDTLRGMLTSSPPCDGSAAWRSSAKLPESIAELPTSVIALIEPCVAKAGPSRLLMNELTSRLATSHEENTKATADALPVLYLLAAAATTAPVKVQADVLPSAISIVEGLQDGEDDIEDTIVGSNATELVSRLSDYLAAAKG